MQDGQKCLPEWRHVPLRPSAPRPRHHRPHRPCCHPRSPWPARRRRPPAREAAPPERAARVHTYGTPRPSAAAAAARHRRRGAHARRQSSQFHTSFAAGGAESLVLVPGGSRSAGTHHSRTRHSPTPPSRVSARQRARPGLRWAIGPLCVAMRASTGARERRRRGSAQLSSAQLGSAQHVPAQLRAAPGADRLPAAPARASPRPPRCSWPARGRTWSRGPSRARGAAPRRTERRSSRQAAENAKSHGSRLRRGAALPSNPRAR